MKRLFLITIFFLGCAQSQKTWNFLPIKIQATRIEEIEVVENFNESFATKIFEISENDPDIEIDYVDGQIRDFGRRGHTLVYSKDGVINKAIVEIDSAFVSGKKYNPSLQCVLTHELGHALGYKNHDSEESKSIMAYTLTKQICKDGPDLYFHNLKEWFQENYGK